MITRVKYLIIGAGISGVTLARIMQENKEENFLLIESEQEAGGLCRTEKIGDHFLDIGGGHFLCSKYPEVYAFIFEHIPRKEFNKYSRISKIKIDNDIIDYPIESNIWQLPLEKEISFLKSVVLNGENRYLSEPKNFEDWIKWKLGDMIAEQYMLPYNKKIWGVQSKEMDIDWLHKIPKLEVDEIIKSCLLKKSDTNKYPSHTYFFYPKKGGFQLIFDSIYQKVKEKVKLNFPAKKVVYKNKRWVVNNQIIAEYVINTAPWPRLYNALGRPQKMKKYFEKLNSNSIVVSLFREKYRHGWHWLYVADPKIEYHRKFYIHNFCKKSAKNGIYTETNYKEKNTLSNRKPIYEYVNKFAYPIPTFGHANAIEKILKYYEKFKLIGLGRWGEWKYYNSDVCIYRAMNLAKEKLNFKVKWLR
jgi:protoporphyrinogen oxidase